MMKVTRHDFKKNMSYYMKIAETEPVIIIRSKLAGLIDAAVLISTKKYKTLKEDPDDR